MRSIVKLILAVVIITFVLAWAPWITDDYAVTKVVEKLGGSEARFDYLGQNMSVGDIPKQVIWLPFYKYVVFPGEAGWFVSFYGSV
jgi:hypothetical protein